MKRANKRLILFIYFAAKNKAFLFLLIPNNDLVFLENHAAMLQINHKETVLYKSTFPTVKNLLHGLFRVFFFCHPQIKVQFLEAQPAEIQLFCFPLSLLHWFFIFFLLQGRTKEHGGPSHCCVLAFGELQLHDSLASLSISSSFLLIVNWLNGVNVTDLHHQETEKSFQKKINVAIMITWFEWVFLFNFYLIFS